MVLTLNFFVSNGACRRTGLDLYADNVNNKYGWISLQGTQLPNNYT